jgi:DNA-binding XRE family transcriptional regulator
MSTTHNKPWSWVNEPDSRRPRADGAGRYVRPLAERDRIVASSFGAEVRRLRNQRELSARRLAEMVGISQPAVTQIENGRRANIELRLLWDFAEALGVSAAHFVSVCEQGVVTAETKRFRRSGKKAAR